MKNQIYPVLALVICISLLLFHHQSGANSSPLKPRIVVLTDVSTWETDDSESLVRLLVHADLFEIEGFVFTSGWSLDPIRDDFIELIYTAIDAYEKDLPNLLKRSNQSEHLNNESKQNLGYWPSPEYLRNRTVVGSKRRGMQYIGKDNDSPGSELIIKIAGEKDNRPVWVLAWGGANTLAQAVWRVQKDRSPKELKKFLQKLRVYTITDQDRDQKTEFNISAHQWLRREFEKDLFFIWDECAWKFQNGTGRENWEEYATHIQNHGNLGNEYPKYKYGVEGDTPSFLHVIPNGLNNPEDPDQAGWGGYFEWGKGPDNETYAYTNHQSPVYDICRKYESHFYPTTFNNFAARMDWAKEGKGNRNPIVDINKKDGIDILENKPKQGKKFTLDASNSYDPDGDELTFKWWVQPEAGTYKQDIAISGNNTSRAIVNIPSDSAGKTFHVICDVTDDGTPNLTSYRRIIFEPKE
jgi:hypothetical protein